MNTCELREGDCVNTLGKRMCLSERRYFQHQRGTDLSVQARTRDPPTDWSRPKPMSMRATSRNAHIQAHTGTHRYTGTQTHKYTQKNNRTIQCRWEYARCTRISDGDDGRQSTLSLALPSRASVFLLTGKGSKRSRLAASQSQFRYFLRSKGTVSPSRARSEATPTCPPVPRRARLINARPSSLRV